MIALNSPIKPNLPKLYKYLEQVNNNGWYTNFGPLQTELTEKLAEYLGVKNLLLVNNGTSALQVAAKALNTASIITTPFSFVATTSAFLWQQDEVAFADIDPNTCNLSANTVKNAFQQGCNADTIVATHVYGNPCDVNRLATLAQQENKKIIYDAAHAFGVNIGSDSVLNYGDASTLSFHATKVFHTVEGGAIVFKEQESYEKAKSLINFGIKPGTGIEGVGINAKLNEYQAAVGLVNLEEMDNILEHRSHLFQLYRAGLKDIVEMPDWHTAASTNGAYMPIILNNAKQRDALSNALLASGIESRHYFSPSLEQSFLQCKNYGSIHSQDLAQRVLCLPLYFHLEISSIEKMISIIKKEIV